MVAFLRQLFKVGRRSAGQPAYAFRAQGFWQEGLPAINSSLCDLVQWQMAGCQLGAVPDNHAVLFSAPVS